MNPQPGGRSPRIPERRRSAGLLHHLEAIVSFSVPRGRSGLSPQGGGRLQRRRRQQVALIQRLLDPLPPGLGPLDPVPERFWRALRWGGGGLFVSWLLGR